MQLFHPFLAFLMKVPFIVKVRQKTGIVQVPLLPERIHKVASWPQMLLDCFRVYETSNEAIQVSTQSALEAVRKGRDAHVRGPKSDEFLDFALDWAFLDNIPGQESSLREPNQIEPILSESLQLLISQEIITDQLALKLEAHYH